MENESKFRSVSLKADLYEELEEIGKEIEAATGIEGLKMPDIIKKLKTEYRANHPKVAVR